MQDFLDVTIRDEVPLAWGHEKFKGLVLEAEDNDSEHHHHGKDAKQHLSQFF